MDRLISKKYAKALYDLGEDLNKNEFFESEVNVLKEVFKEKEVILFLRNPKIEVASKKMMIKNTLQNKVSKEIVNLIYILIEKRRQEYILDVFAMYEHILNKKKDVFVAKISSATNLKKEQVASIKEILQEKTGKQIEVETEVDKTLIAGFKVKFGDYIIDRTINEKIENLKKLINNISFV